ncbi:DUF1648 domain-containing protein [Phytoactinopolyspora halotolerans]|uniref:DUF1648 domain-containing protein n=1 Tax=Phytoactinopolyspora halotolerans TaxID=1981512 RepID=A0A6L9S1Q9_9ACTN|nr:DUF1648 domain-containing protein [Phytoactinopolyspora halotolerans]NED98750.1 DUF1648 domain-containing protein [Phytoactinopolyspora halotolerans]
MTRLTPPTPEPAGLFRPILAAAGIPAVVAAIGATLVQSWRDELPARVAIHWGTDGPDGYASVTGVVTTIAAFGVAFAAIGLVLCLAVRHESIVTRVIAGMTSGATTFVTALVAGLAADQRGVADARDAELSAVIVLTAFILAAGVTASAVYTVPRHPAPSTRMPADAPQIPLGESERVMWTRSAGAGGSVMIMMAVITVVTAVIAVVSGLWFTLAFTAIVVAFIALMCSIRVIVDERGVTVRGTLGWPRIHTPLDEIAHARTVRVHPIRHFGGYGLRVAVFGPYRGATGFILHGGTGVLVEKTDGHRTIVVVDDAETAAGLINSMAMRRTRNG